MSSQGVAARRYATALADVVIARNEAREVQQELADWEAMVSGNAQLLEVFRNPTVPYEQKRNVLSALIKRAGVRPSTANFLQVLLQNNRLAELKEINERFGQELDARSGVVSAYVTTARPLQESMQQALRAQLKQLTGREVRIEFSVDEELLGGVTTRIGSTVYDGSVRNQLEQVKHRLIGER